MEPNLAFCLISEVDQSHILNFVFVVSTKMDQALYIYLPVGDFLHYRFVTS